MPLAPNTDDVVMLLNTEVPLEVPMRDWLLAPPPSAMPSKSDDVAGAGALLDALADEKGELPPRPANKPSTAERAGAELLKTEAGACDELAAGGAANGEAAGEVTADDAKTDDGAAADVVPLPDRISAHGSVPEEAADNGADMAVNGLPPLAVLLDPMSP